MCTSHYRKYSRLIREERTTWDKVTENACDGIEGPNSDRGRPVGGSGVCVINSCDGKSVARGLCPNHYGQASRRVKAKSLTWDKLVKKGLALPSSADEYGPSPFDLDQKETAAKSKE